MEYRLARPDISYRNEIVVVGCGGTGGYVAEGLCRLLTGRREIGIVLVDPDRVEPHNLLRQNFYLGDVGRFKSRALAERLSRLYQRPLAYSIEPFTQEMSHKACLILGCVDNALARGSIAKGYTNSTGPWWIDAGNGLNLGQVLIGNATPRGLYRSSFDSIACVCHRLPLPTIQQPELLAPVPGEVLEPDCAEAVIAEAQSPTINQAMAVLLVEVVRRLLAGDCPWMQLYLDMGNGSLRGIPATPERASHVTRMKSNQLMTKPVQKRKEGR